MRKKLVDIIKNVIDRHFHVDQLFVADLSPYQIIFTDDLMSVKTHEYTKVNHQVNVQNVHNLLYSETDTFTPDL